MSENAIQSVRLAGGQSALARAIGVTQGLLKYENHQKISQKLQLSQWLETLKHTNMA
jgi:hypothetical protein